MARARLVVEVDERDGGGLAALADEEIEVAVAVEIGERDGGGVGRRDVERRRLLAKVAGAVVEPDVRAGAADRHEVDAAVAVDVAGGGGERCRRAPTVAASA